MINEPTAAAMAYGLNKKNGTLSRGLILVFDFGGGTLGASGRAFSQRARDWSPPVSSSDRPPPNAIRLGLRAEATSRADVSLLGLERGVFHTLAIAGNAHLGGEDFTHTLYVAAVAEYSRRTGAALTDPAALQRLWLAAEAAKVALSSAERHVIGVETVGGAQFEWELDRVAFEAITAPLFAKVGGGRGEAAWTSGGAVG